MTKSHLLYSYTYIFIYEYVIYKLHYITVNTIFYIMDCIRVCINVDLSLIISCEVANPDIKYIYVDIYIYICVNVIVSNFNVDL